MCTNTWHNYACSCEYFAGVQPCLAAGMRCPGGRQCKTKPDKTVDYYGPCRRCIAEWIREAGARESTADDPGVPANFGSPTTLGLAVAAGAAAPPGLAAPPSPAVATAGPANASGDIPAAAAAPVAPVSTVAVDDNDNDEGSDDDSDGGVIFTPSSGHSRSSSAAGVEREAATEEGLGGDFVFL